MAKVWGTLVVMGLLVVFDGLVIGQGVFTVLVGCVMLLYGLVVGLRNKEPAKLIATRVGIPVVASAMVIGLVVLNSRVGEARAAEVVAACERFEAAEGRFPDSLDELVPGHLDSVPRARVSLAMSDFNYWVDQDGNHSVWWVVYPPFLRKRYEFEEKRWSGLD